MCGVVCGVVQCAMWKWQTSPYLVRTRSMSTWRCAAKVAEMSALMEAKKTICWDSWEFCMAGAKISNRSMTALSISHAFSSVREMSRYYFFFGSAFQTPSPRLREEAEISWFRHDLGTDVTSADVNFLGKNSEKGQYAKKFFKRPITFDCQSLQFHYCTSLFVLRQQ